MTKKDFLLIAMIVFIAASAPTVVLEIVRGIWLEPYTDADCDRVAPEVSRTARQL